MVAAKDNAAGVAFLNQFIESVRDSGFLKPVLERAKLSGVKVAPAKQR